RWIVDRNGGDFDILLLALKVTGLDKVVDDPTQDLTVFAPTDDTFRATFGGRSELRVLFNVLRAVDYDKDALANVLLYHVTALNTDDEKGLSSDEVLANVPIDVPMVNGGTAFASFDGTSLTLEGGSSAPSVVNLGAIDIGRGTASNGIIHVIGESVLLP
ncbi:MAG: hypothetical protein HKN01_09870, partial [Acidimicrobiia bacterium]|nr:hypothetical protein [Acidimicrobiia bacterium]